jgi:hypothetical protein
LFLLWSCFVMFNVVLCRCGMPGSSFDYTWVEWERRVIGLKVRAISSFRLPMYRLFAIHLDLNSLIDKSTLKYDIHTGCVKVKLLTNHWP